MLVVVIKVFVTTIGASAKVNFDPHFRQSVAAHPRLNTLCSAKLYVAAFARLAFFLTVPAKVLMTKCSR